jgi:hypothetical protein
MGSTGLTMRAAARFATLLCPACHGRGCVCVPATHGANLQKRCEACAGRGRIPLRDGGQTIEWTEPDRHER